MDKNRFRRSVFRVTGLNRERLLNLLRRRGVVLYDVRETGEKSMEFSLPARQEENFFAITASLCYNVEKIGERGAFALPARLLKRTGLLLGAAAFVLGVCLGAGAVFSVDYYGSGAVYKERAEAVLESCGITPFSFVNEKTLEKAETEILKREKAFSFVSVKKRGTRLKVNLVLSPVPPDIVDTERTALVSPVSGVVESITVLRGAALVQAGDAVEAGDTLISGQTEVKEEIFETYVLGCVRILTEEIYEYRGKDGEEDAARAFAEAQTEHEIAEIAVYKERAGEEFLYTVKALCRITVK